MPAFATPSRQSRPAHFLANDRRSFWEASTGRASTPAGYFSGWHYPEGEVEVN